MLIRRGGRGGGTTDFKFGTFIGYFKSDSAANMEVKGLKLSICLSLSLSIYNFKKEDPGA